MEDFVLEGKREDEVVAFNKWNWGAAFLSFPYAFGSNSYLCLIGLIPVVSWFWWIICGMYGEKWAWNSGKFRSKEEFYIVQNSWNRAGFIVGMITIMASLLAIIIFLAIGTIAGAVINL